ncbi:MAG TPA: lipopolysaccharide heptosyltransferase II [Planctomycetaceae bacterium]|nr:lipopolysaccharide heptosyltransferase II [Planctomycetaceae bacterium]
MALAERIVPTQALLLSRLRSCKTHDSLHTRPVWPVDARTDPPQTGSTGSLACPTRIAGAQVTTLMNNRRLATRGNWAWCAWIGRVCSRLPSPLLCACDNAAFPDVPFAAFSMNIAVFLPNWIGDAVMATPVLRALRRRYPPPVRLVGIMRPYMADLLGGTDWLDEQWYFDPRSRDPRLKASTLARRMRLERFDMAILLPNSLRSALVAWWGGAVERVGYVRDFRGPLLTHKVYPPRSAGRRPDEPMVDYYLRIAEAVGCGPESRRLELATTLRDEASADRVWERLGLRKGDRVVLLNTGSSNGQTRCWPAPYFARLARWLVTRRDQDVLVICGPRERSTARWIAEQSRSKRVFSMADEALDLGTAKACIRRARMMISTDSGPRHVAAAFGKPVVTLYGPTIPVWSANPTVQSIDLYAPLECLGCCREYCPRRHQRCMRDLSVERVHAAVEELLETEWPAAAEGAVRSA